MKIISLLIFMSLMVVLASFTVLNAHPVAVHFLIFKTEWPLIIVMLLTFMAGMTLTVLLLLLPMAKQLLRNKLARHKIYQLEKKLLQNQEGMKQITQ